MKPLLDQTRVARLLGVEVETLGAWRRRGYGPRWYRIGRNIKYAEDDLRGWMKAQALSLADSRPAQSVLRGATPSGKEGPHHK